MDRDDLDTAMKTLLKQIDRFKEDPSFENALAVDATCTILHFSIGEQNWAPLHYFQTHWALAKEIVDHKLNEDIKAELAKYKTKETK